MLRNIISTLLLITIWHSTLAKNSEGRIIGGREVSITKHPYLVSIRRKTCINCAYTHVCGGVIYLPQAILTAAHCVYKREENSFVVIAGSDNRAGSDGFIVRVKEIVIHENYQPALSKNDIAILILDSAIPINGINTWTITLADEEPQADSLAVVSGWGATVEGGPSSAKLQEVELNIVNRNECDANYGYQRIEENMLCAGSKIGGKDACQYDSGGPLVGNNRLIGIVSWGIGCARPEYPGVYANVAYFKQWIESVTENFQ